VIGWKSDTLSALSPKRVGFGTEKNRLEISSDKVIHSSQSEKKPPRVLYGMCYMALVVQVIRVSSARFRI
jgi:hypothetical protein